MIASILGISITAMVPWDRSLTIADLSETRPPWVATSEEIKRLYCRQGTD
jgi:hypothetical protein